MDYLTSANFLDMLDTGILICHLVRIIQDRAKVILSHHVHNEGSAPANKPSEPAATVPGDPATTAGATAATAAIGATTANNDVINDVKMAQQYLHALLRGANNNSTALAAAKVNFKKLLIINFIKLFKFLIF